MIEDIIAQSHTLVDTLNFQAGSVALAALKTIGESDASTGPFNQLLGMRFHEFQGGRCVASLDVRSHLLNPLGIAHGGVTFSIADSACGGAAVSAVGARAVVTQDMQIRYHGPVRSGTITAEARVIHHGKRTITVECRVKQKEALVASVTATFAILSEAELGEIGKNSPG